MSTILVCRVRAMVPRSIVLVLAFVLGLTFTPVATRLARGAPRTPPTSQNAVAHLTRPATAASAPRPMPKLAVAPARGILYPRDHSAVNFYVAPRGNDSNPGSLERPFATLQRARNAIRELKAGRGLPRGGVTVWLRGGKYHLTETFRLTQRDSGTAAAPIVYRAYPHEKAELIGARRITGFHHLTAASTPRRIAPRFRSQILVANLKAVGITNFGRITAQGFGRPFMPLAPALYFRNRPMTLARWPWHGWARAASAPAGGHGPTFGYAGHEPDRWVHDPDVWLHAFWHINWADFYEKVSAIDARRHLFVTAKPYGGWRYRRGQRYYALNLLSELRHPGEYYLGRRTGRLYFWPPQPLTRGAVYLSMLGGPLVRMQDVSHVALRGLVLEFSRSDGIRIVGGHYDQVAGCTLRGLGGIAIGIGNDTAHPRNVLKAHLVGHDGVLSCDIYDTGEGGIVLGGGNRLTLQPGGDYAINNIIHNSNVVTYCWGPAILISGVGNYIGHNLIYDQPNFAIFLHGNNHLIEYNVVHDVCLQMDDNGAFYMGRDYTQRGNVVRYNLFANVHSHYGHLGDQGVYLDDLTSGTTVVGNIFLKTQRGVLIGGGRDNRIQNNLFLDCPLGIWIDARGTSWAKAAVYGGIKKLLAAVNAFHPPYSVRYPHLLNLQKYYRGTPGIPPADNVVARNIEFGGKQWIALGIRRGIAPGLIRRDNSIGVNPNVVNIRRIGFKPIPLRRIGLYQDRYRLHLPRPFRGWGILRAIGSCDGG